MRAGCSYNFGEGDGTGEEPALTTAIGDDSSSMLSCSNSDATLRYPQDGDAVSGRVEVLGVANIAGFAFYKLEIRGISVNDTWRAIAAGTKVVCGPGCDDEFILGSWDTSLITSGEYEFRLVVMDTVGNAPMPCTIRVRVLPVE